MRPSIIAVTTALLVASALPNAAQAQEVYGRLWVAPNNAPAAGAEVTVTCGDSFKESAKADRRGLYRLDGPRRSARCALRVSHQGKESRPVWVHLSERRTKADFELRARGSVWSLVRR